MSAEEHNMETDAAAAAAAAAAEDDRKLFVGGLPQEGKESVSQAKDINNFISVKLFHVINFLKIFKAETFSNMYSFIQIRN